MSNYHRKFKHDFSSVWFVADIPFLEVVLHVFLTNNVSTHVYVVGVVLCSLKI